MKSGLTIGFALTGSFCTFHKAIPQIQILKDAGAEVLPIMSETSAKTDTRFGLASDHIERIEGITGHKVISSISDAEPIGPKKLLDLLIVAPCTGNTISKLANGIADSTVSLAAKSHLRNKRPLVIAVSSNDGLGANAKNIGVLLSRANVYMVPFGQDDCVEKENSLVADFDQVLPTVEAALNGKQLQPVLVCKA